MKWDMTRMLPALITGIEILVTGKKILSSKTTVTPEEISRIVDSAVNLMNTHKTSIIEAAVTISDSRLSKPIMEKTVKNTEESNNGKDIVLDPVNEHIPGANDKEELV